LTGVNFCYQYATVTDFWVGLLNTLFI